MRDRQQGLSRARRLIVFATLGAPLVFANGLLLPYVVPKAFYLQMLTGLALILLALDGLRGEHPVSVSGWRPGETPFLWALLAFVLVALLAGLAGSSPSRSLFGTLERRWGVLTWMAFLGFYLLLRTDFGGRGWRRVLQVTVGVAVAVAFYGLAHAGGWWPGQEEPVGWSRMSSTLGNPGYLAPYLTLGAVFAGYLALRTAKPRRCWLWVGAATVQVSAVLLSGTRAVVMGTGVAALALTGAGALHGSSRRRRWAAGAGFAAVAGFALIGLLSSGGSDTTVISWWDRLLSAVSTDTGSARFRLVAWGASLDAVREAPLLGVGPENFQLAWSRYFDPVMYHISASPLLDRAHNVLVNAAVTTGLPGLAAYLAMWGAVGWDLHRAQRRGALSGPEASVLAFGAITYFVYLLFWFEDHSSFLVFIVLAGLIGHLASGGEPPGDGDRRDVSATEDGGVSVSSPPSPSGSSNSSSSLLRLGVAAVLIITAGVLAWHNVRVLKAARNAWDGEYSYEAWAGVENFRSALAPGLPGSAPILNAYLRRLTFLTSRGDSGGPERPTPRMNAALAAADSALAGWAARDPHNPWVYIQRSRFCGIRQDVLGGTAGRDCAAESLRRAIELSPGQIRFRHWLASHHLTAGEPERALEVLNGALGVYDSFGETYHYIARVHRHTGDMEEAVRRTEIAISLGYGGQPAPFVLELADWLAGEGRFGAAADLLESHLALRYRRLARPELAIPGGKGFQPWDLPLASRLPLLHWRAGRPDEAIRTARFLAHRLGGPDEAGGERNRGIRRFVDDVEAGRMEPWADARGVLERPKPGPGEPAGEVDSGAPGRGGRGIGSEPMTPG